MLLLAVAAAVEEQEEGDGAGDVEVKSMVWKRKPKALRWW